MSDMTGDGVTDVGVVDYSGNSLTVLSGRGDGTFGPMLVVGLDQEPTSFAVGDFNGDGIPDLVVTLANNDIGILLGLGNGVFSTQADFATG